MRFIWEHVRHWHLDIPTLLITLFVLPLATYLIGIIRRHAKLWGGYLVEGLMYWLGRLVVHSIAARFSLRRYCRLQLQKENQYVYVPSRGDVKLEIDRVFVNLTLEGSSNSENYDQRTILSAGPRVRVIGDPGSGKSSLVKRLFRDACTDAMTKPAKARLPILIELKNLKIPRATADGKLGDWFVRFLREEVKKSAVYKMDECFDNYARMSGLLVLLDGLDEVASSEYERVKAAIMKLSEHLSNLSQQSMVVLTMRTQLHQQITGSFRDSLGKALFVKPFTPSDVYEFPESEIYRRHGNPIVRDGKIEFDPERRPRTAITNVSFLDRRIGVEHRLAGDFVYAGIKVSADIGKYRTFQALIFKIDGAPVMVHPAIRQVVSQGIRIVEAGAGELIERRIWVRQSFFVGGQRKCILPDSYLRPSCRCASDQQNRKQVVDSHQVAIRRCRAAFS